MREALNKPQSDHSPKKRKTSLDYSELGTPEFQAGLTKLAKDYPDAVKRHFDQLRSNAPDKTTQ